MFFNFFFYSVVVVLWTGLFFLSTATEEHGDELFGVDHALVVDGWLNCLERVGDVLGGELVAPGNDGVLEAVNKQCPNISRVLDLILSYLGQGKQNHMKK